MGVSSPAEPVFGHDKGPDETGSALTLDKKKLLGPGSFRFKKRP
jgi:hypothetical protein